MINGLDALPLFYEEPDPDRWLPFDRYPRRVIRRLLRRSPSPGGHRRVFLNLCAGLDRLGVPYRVNDYRWLARHPGVVACVVGKPFVLDKVDSGGPILFGAAVHSHPVDDPDLLERLPVTRVLVPGEWMRRMFEPVQGAAVHAWPVGIDTDLWHPSPNTEKDFDILLYDKVRWEHDRYDRELITPIREVLQARGLRVAIIRYGFYREEEFHALLARCRAMLFLCEHETQGIAYQQTLSAGVPILAWDRGGPWQDPAYYPDRVVFGPVTSVPYWDDRCGLTFQGLRDFEEQLDRFLERLRIGDFAPRDYVLENLTLERCAAMYLEHAAAAARAGDSDGWRADCTKRGSLQPRES